MTDEQTVGLDETRRCIYMLIAARGHNEDQATLAGTVYNAVAHHGLVDLDEGDHDTLRTIITGPITDGAVTLLHSVAEQLTAAIGK